MRACFRKRVAFKLIDRSLGLLCGISMIPNKMLLPDWNGASCLGMGQMMSDLPREFLPKTYRRIHPRLKR